MINSKNNIQRNIEFTNLYDAGEKMWWKDNDHMFSNWRRKNFIVNEKVWNDWVDKNVDIECCELKTKDVVENYGGRAKTVNSTIFTCGVSIPSEGEIEIEYVHLRWDLKRGNDAVKKMITEIEDMCIVHKEKYSVQLIVKDNGDSISSKEYHGFDV
jgi:hypothetical protein